MREVLLKFKQKAVEVMQKLKPVLCAGVWNRPRIDQAITEAASRAPSVLFQMRSNKMLFNHLTITRKKPA